MEETLKAYGRKTNLLLARWKEVLQYKTIDNWDGKLPVYNGSGLLPMLKINQ